MLVVHELNMQQRIRDLEESRLHRSPEIKVEQAPTMTSSPMDRIRAKALQARGIVPAAIKAFEAELDGIIAEDAVIRQKQDEALAPHKESIKGLHGQFDELKAAMELMGNGGPPLEDPLPVSEKPAEGS